jgi:hypothetical protein
VVIPAVVDGTVWLMVFLWCDDVVADGSGRFRLPFVQVWCNRKSVDRPGLVATWWKLLVRYSNNGCERSHLSRKIITI